MLYLDNAATSFPKPRAVSREVMRCITRYCGNPSRSSHYFSMRAAEEVYLARELVASFFGSPDAERVVFTQNATYALNLAIRSLLTEPCHVLISDLEHNSTLRPILKLTERFAYSYSVFSTEGDLRKNLEACIRPSTRAIISTLASNVNGRIVAPKIISEFASEKGLISIADASQYAGHFRLDLEKSPFTALCAPAHKGLLGIQGAGFAIFEKGAKTETVFDGGSGSESLSPGMPKELPERLEAGTLPTPPIVGLRKGIEFICKCGIDEVRFKLDAVADAFADRLRSLKCAEVFYEGCGIVSFRLKNLPCDAVASLLDRAGICVRSGLHCAPLAHKTLGTEDTGLVRISLSVFNRKNQADIFYRELKRWIG